MCFEQRTIANDWGNSRGGSVACGIKRKRAAYQREREREGTGVRGYVLPSTVLIKRTWHYFRSILLLLGNLSRGRHSCEGRWEAQGGRRREETWPGVSIRPFVQLNYSVNELDVDEFKWTYLSLAESFVRFSKRGQSSWQALHVHRNQYLAASVL